MDWPTHCIHGNPIQSDAWCEQCKAANLVDTEVEAVGWAILQALHEHVPEDKRPMSWSDLDQDHEARIRAAAVGAIETIRTRDAAVTSQDNIRR